LQAFFDMLGDRRHTVKAISIDMSAGYENAIQAVAGQDEQFRPQGRVRPLPRVPARQPRRR